MSAIDTEIERHRVAMLLHQSTLDALSKEAAGACCPTCFHGKVYTDAVARQKRCGETMMRLLTKRGTEDDVQFAKAIRMSAWP